MVQPTRAHCPTNHNAVCSNPNSALHNHRTRPRLAEYYSPSYWTHCSLPSWKKQELMNEKNWQDYLRLRMSWLKNARSMSHPQFHKVQAAHYK
jgi:hypothetical protein